MNSAPIKARFPKPISVCSYIVAGDYDVAGAFLTYQGIQERSGVPLGFPRLRAVAAGRRWTWRWSGRGRRKQQMSLPIA